MSQTHPVRAQPDLSQVLLAAQARDRSRLEFLSSPQPHTQPHLGACGTCRPRAVRLYLCFWVCMLGRAGPSCAPSIWKPTPFHPRPSLNLTAGEILLACKPHQPPLCPNLAQGSWVTLDRMKPSKVPSPPWPGLLLLSASLIPLQPHACPRAFALASLPVNLVPQVVHGSVLRSKTLSSPCPKVSLSLGIFHYLFDSCLVFAIH